MPPVLDLGNEDDCDAAPWHNHDISWSWDREWLRILMNFSNMSKDDPVGRSDGLALSKLWTITISQRQTSILYYWSFSMAISNNQRVGSNFIQFFTPFRQWSSRFPKSQAWWCNSQCTSSWRWEGANRSRMRGPHSGPSQESPNRAQLTSVGCV